MPSPTLGRSVWAAVAGFLVVFILSMLGDLASLAAGLIPPDGAPSESAFLIFTIYRVVFTVAGGYVTARLAPRNPVKHAVILGAIGTVIALIGAITMQVKGFPGPAWYSWVLVLTGVPLTWLGAKLREA